MIADGDFYYKRKAVYGDMTRIFYHIKDDIRKGILDRIVLTLLLMMRVEYVSQIGNELW